ncbi:F-box only protein 34 [Kryptolebias marmoratus]|uniref:F-box protein 34 n=1 Tax=Kryptolebias marmoratus TaxID=37003 RepID=A0A3Q3B6L9_KRYMA|nr:F-box only protein 34 [Kryptolebias marmoratus]
MHLKSYPKLMRSELRLDATSVQALSQRSQQGALLRTVSGHASTTRLPFSIISSNTLRCSNATSLCLKGANGCPAPPPVCENTSPGPAQTATEDADAPQNMWTIIKPGHVREKIAIFTSEDRRTDGAERTSGGSASSWGREVTACTNGATLTGLPRAAKAKGSWQENSSAKRRRRSGNNLDLQQDQRTNFLNEQQQVLRPAPADPTGPSGGDQRCGTAPEEEQKVSVVEMVAILEQRANELKPELKPLLTLQRSSTTITLTRTSCRADLRQEEEPETVRVSEMVARLESECLRRTEGGLSRSNSLRRAVGRVLLASGEQNFTSCQPSSPSVTSSSSSSSQSEGRSKEPISSPQKVRVEAAPSPQVTVSPSRELGVEPQEAVAPPPQSEEAEPLPGLLFASLPPDKADAPHYKTSFYFKPGPSSEKSISSAAASGTSCSPAAPLRRSGSASQDFLEVRQRLQQLLMPQPYLSVLPHHLLVKILLLLPTQSLAALKCTCSYFRFIIETYGVRPADSLWVSDPRYRDDPCKQCKRRYCPGDVSLCRWHHKPYCQALPYGPGYWMCCHSTQRDAPGCNVGLHDNRWVPAFHSINVPIYRRSCSHDN